MTCPPRQTVGEAGRGGGIRRLSSSVVESGAKARQGSGGKKAAKAAEKAAAAGGSRLLKQLRRQLMKYSYDGYDGSRCLRRTIPNRSCCSIIQDLKDTLEDLDYGVCLRRLLEEAAEEPDSESVEETEEADRGVRGAR